MSLILLERERDQNFKRLYEEHTRTLLTVVHEGFDGE